MKIRTQLLALALTLFAGVGVQAQNIDFGVNPIGVLFGRPSITAEYGVTETFGLEASVDGVFTNNKVLNGGYKGRGIGAGLVGKVYFGPQEGNDRFYGMLYSRFAGINNTASDEDFDDVNEYRRFKVGLGVGAGFKWVANNNLTFEIAAGLGKNVVNDYSGSDLDENPDFRDALTAFTSLDGYGKLGVGYRIGG